MPAWIQIQSSVVLTSTPVKPTTDHMFEAYSSVNDQSTTANQVAQNLLCELFEAVVNSLKFK